LGGERWGKKKGNTEERAANLKGELNKTPKLLQWNENRNIGILEPEEEEKGIIVGTHGVGVTRGTLLSAARNIKASEEEKKGGR